MSDFHISSIYEIVQLIGKGTISNVFKAQDVIEQRIVALKVLCSEGQEDVERFKKEFLLLSQIKHPNIVKVFDFGFTNDGNPFFSMEFIEGKDFRGYFKELDYQKFYQILIEILKTLEFLHSKGIIHGDIKPSNIFISSDEEGNPVVKFTDFGFAEYGKVLEQLYWKGTIPYLAPEIIRGEEYNHQVDLYSLGVMLYEVLTGKLPFEEFDLMSIAKSHLEKEPEFPRDLKIPESLKHQILKLLKKDPLDRYYSARELREEIEQASGIKLEEVDSNLIKSLMASTDFIGREEDFSLLKYLYEEMKCGRTEVIHLEGECGVGKTRLLEEFKNFVQIQGGLVIWKNIAESGEMLIPEPQSLSIQTHPIVLIIDDFQKVNLELLDSLINWLNQTKKEKVLFCFVLNNNLTLSEDDRKAEKVEAVLRSNLYKAPTKIILKPLKEEETAHLISSTFKWKGEEEKISQTVYQKTGGNPSLIISSMNSLVEQGYLKRAGLSWELDAEGLNKISAPESYVSQIKDRLHRLSPDSLNLIETASVLGEEFESDILREVAGCTEEEMANYMTTVFLERLLEAKSSPSDKKFAFVNDIVRDLIYREIDEDRRKGLHEKCGQVLEESYSTDKDAVIDRLACHFVQAEKKELAFKYSFLAGGKAERENTHEEAIKHYENSLKFYEQGLEKSLARKEEILAKLGRQYVISGNFDKALGLYFEAIKYVKQEEQIPDRIAKLYQELGVLYLRKGDYEKAIKILKEGLSICSEVQFPKVSAELNTTLGWVYQRKSDYPEAVSCFQRSIELLGKENSKELGLALNGLGVVYWTLGEFNKALNCYNKSLIIFEELKEENSLATVYTNLGLLSRSKDKAREALKYFEKALYVKQKYGVIADLSFLYNNIALTWENLYEWDKSLEYHLKSYELKEKMGDQKGLANTLTNLGLVYLRRGALNKSLESHSKALKLFQNLKDKRGVAYSCFNLGEVYLLKEEWPKSKTYLEKSLRLRQELDDKSGLADSLSLLGRFNLETGDFSSASFQLKESLRLYDNLENQKKMVEVSLSLTELGLGQDNKTEAEVHLNYAEKLLKSIEDQALKGKFKRITGILLKQRGKVEESLREFLEAVEVFKRLKMRYELGIAYLEIGKIKSDLGKFKEAKAYSKEALAIFKDMEIPTKVSECEGLMKELSNFTQIDQQRIQILYQVSELLNNITDLDELLVKILDLAIEHLSAERAAVILYCPQDDSLEPKATRGIEKETKEDALSISRRVIRDVLKTDEPLIIEDTRSDPEISLYKSVITYNILSILCVPLITKNKTLGTIYVDHRSLSGIFSKEDLYFLKAFANLIAVALEKAELYNELNEEVFQLKKDLRKTYSFPNIVGRNKKMQDVFHMVEKVANSKTSILILGESGTGKELIANLIHYTSVRKDKSFVKVNCAALPESLLESELFGVEEKVATGVAMRDGKFKHADGGTIFFDEIGDMSLSTQAKVLRVLQEREFERVGGNKTLKVDIRVISATNKDLEECIKKGVFRKDLFYRLNPVSIKIPLLRERKEDIPYLIDYFLEKFSQENSKPKITIPVKAMNVLIDYPWPGNVRELANLMEKAVLFSEDGSFPKEYLPTKSQIQRDIKLLTSKESLPRVLGNLEREIILQALVKNNWNQVKTAFQLGIGEATLRRRMAKHRLKKP
ncbi:MAG: sigma 54-interacting transcriptional regulator [Candidatus Zixiibacteriota bacterium]